MFETFSITFSKERRSVLTTLVPQISSWSVCTNRCTVRRLSIPVNIGSAYSVEALEISQTTFTL